MKLDWSENRLHKADGRHERPKNTTPSQVFVVSMSTVADERKKKKTTVPPMWELNKKKKKERETFVALLDCELQD